MRDYYIHAGNARYTCIYVCVLQVYTCDNATDAYNLITTLNSAFQPSCPRRKCYMSMEIVSLVSPVSLSLLQTLVIFPRSANINHQGTQISQPLSVLPHLGAWKKSGFFQNDGLTECKITRFMLLPLTLLKMR